MQHSKEFLKGNFPDKRIIHPKSAIFEKSRQAALACLAKFPKAHVCYRGQEKNLELKWTPLTAQQIKNSPPGLFAVIICTIHKNMSCIDLDRRGDSHPKGGSPKVLNGLYKQWFNYDDPYRQKSPSGGLHILRFCLDTTLKGHANKAGKGVDLLFGRQLLMLYEPRLWEQSFKEIYRLPQGFFTRMERVNKIKAWLKKYYGKGKSKAGTGNTNQFLNSGYSHFKNSKSFFQLSEKSFEIAKSYLENPGKTHIKEAINKLARSMQDSIPHNKNLKPKGRAVRLVSMADKIYQNAVLPGWFVPDWIKKTGVILLSADKGVGKTSIALLLMQALTTGTHSFFKTDDLLKQFLFLYCERHPAFYRELWSALKGDPKTMFPWRWASEYKKEKENLLNWEINNLRAYVQKEKDTQAIVVDRGDLLAKKNTKYDIRVALIELDEIAQEYGRLFILTRHTSKPQGQDSRQFKERTDGFKEWQHIPSVCLMLHAHGDKLLLFKQYSNESKKEGLIEFGWQKQSNGLVIPVYKSFAPDMTLDAIEKKYNPRGQVSQKRAQRINLYKIFETHGRRDPRCIKPGTQDIIPAWVLSAKKVMSLLPGEREDTTFKRLQAIGGWSKRQFQDTALWHCPVK